mgnify:CR=1 FL=1
MQNHPHTAWKPYQISIQLHDPLGGNHAAHAELPRLNDQLDRLNIPHGLNESIIEHFLDRMDRCRPIGQPVYWLLTARLIEVGLLCAGHYANNCEYAAVGDLLVNPRKITIHNGSGPARVKNRHGRLSDQLATEENICSLDVLRSCLRSTKLQIEKPPLLRLLLDRMIESGRFAADYLDDVHRRMQAVADTIGFLCAWSIHGMEDLYNRLRDAPADMRSFVEGHRCHFDTHYFRCLGRDIRQIHNDPEYRSEFLIDCGS